MPLDPHRHLTLVRPPLSEASQTRRFLQRKMPDSWRFAHQTTIDLARRLEFLAWAGRADAFDTYFLRQAEAMLRPSGLTELIGGAAPLGEDQTAPDLEERLARFCTWSRAIVTAVLLELVHDAGGELGGDLEVELAAQAEVHLAGGRLLGDGDARDAEDDPLERGGDGPGVRDVVAEVRAVVDAGHDDLGVEAVDEPELGEPDAVDRGAVGRIADRPVVEVDLLDPERPPRRDHPRHRRPVAVRRDDGELDVRELQQRAAERLQPLGLDAVVVGQQHAHAREDSREVRGLLTRPGSSPRKRRATVVQPLVARHGGTRWSPSGSNATS